MSSLIRPVVLEPCQSTLRGRRRSSIHPLSTVPRLLTTGPSFLSEGSAVSDEPQEQDAAPTLPTPALSPLSTIHGTEYFDSPTLPERADSFPSACDSPASTTAPSRVLSHKSETPSESSDPGQDRLKWRLASGFLAYFLCGWGDGVTATVLPFFKAEFHMSPMVSTLLFAGNTVGFTIGTLLVESFISFLGRISLEKTEPSMVPFLPILRRLITIRRDRVPQNAVGFSSSQARHLLLIIGCIFHSLNFVMLASARGFSALFCAYGLAAFSRSLWTATLNDYYASGPKQSIGLSYGLWSFGGVVSPLVCQSLVSAGVPWPRFYYGSLVLSGINAFLLFCTFKPTLREFLRDREQALADHAKKSQSLSGMPSPVDSPRQPKTRSSFLHALTMVYQWAFSIFAFLYTGSETSTQGLMVTYLLAHANPKTAGYVTSGFWGGITIGRFLWGYFEPLMTFTQRKLVVLTSLFVSFSEKTVSNGLNTAVVIALVMQILIWVINSSVENAVSASIIGTVYGPIFPACLSMANDLVPPEVHMSSMTIISTFSSIGSAVFPLIAGAVADVSGAQTLTYLTVPLGATMVCLWLLLPSRIPSRLSVD